MITCLRILIVLLTPFFAAMMVFALALWIDWMGGECHRGIVSLFAFIIAILATVMVAADQYDRAS